MSIGARNSTKFRLQELEEAKIYKFFAALKGEKKNVSFFDMN